MKAKFNKLDRSKLSKEVNSILDKIKKATDNFKKEDKKAEALFDRLYDKIKEGKPEAIKSTKKPSKSKKKKTSGGNRGVFTKLAKSIRDAKPSLTWKQAMAEASKKLKADKEKANKKFSSSIQTLIDANKKYFGSAKASSLEKDAKQPAKPIGKRRSKNGKTYYEYRTNRTDVKQPPKSFPMLEKGGLTKDEKLQAKISADDFMYQFRKKKNIVRQNFGENTFKEFDRIVRDKFSSGKNYEQGGVVDLFENYETLPKKVRDTIDFYMQKYQDGDYTYEDSKRFLKEMQKQGYTFEYGLDNEPYDLRKMAKGGIVWKKNIGNDGWSATMENESAYDNVGGYISESGNWKIFRDGRFYKREDGYENYKRDGNWIVEGNDDFKGMFATLSEAKKYVERWIATNPKDYAKGGKIGFEGLAKKVAKNYEGKKVKPKFQSEYGKTYDKEEAMQVGRAVAGKVLKQQNMKKMEDGGIVREEGVAYQGGMSYGTTENIAPQFAKGGKTDEDLRFERTIQSSLENMKKGDRKRDEMAKSKFGVSYDELHPLKQQDILDEYNKRFVYGNEKLAKGGITKGKTLSENFNRGDVIKNIEFWNNDIIVQAKDGKVARIDLDKGERIELSEKGGRLTARTRFTDYDLDRLSYDFVVFDDRVETEDGKVVGTINSKGHLIPKGDKTLKNPLVKWLQQNSYVTNEEYQKLAKGGSIDDLHERVEDLVKDLSSDEYEVFASDNNIDPEDANEMSDFIYDLNKKEAEKIIAQLKGKYAKGGEVKYAIYEDYDGNDIKTEKFDKGRDEDEIFAPSGYNIADFDEDDDGVVYVRFQQEEEFAKGGKTQGYNARLDESLGNRKGRESTKQQSKKDRRDESKGMEKGSGRRAYSSVSTMDVGDRKMAKGGKFSQGKIIKGKSVRSAIGDMNVSLVKFVNYDGEDYYRILSYFADINDATILSQHYNLKDARESFNEYVSRFKNKEFAKGGNVPKRFLDEKGERKNDPETIEKLTKYVMSLPQTKSKHYNKVTKKYSPKRQKLHRQIINEFKGDLVCIESDEPIAILMGGSPASGKSTFLRKYAPYLLKEELLRIDADEVRAMLPEYKGWNASATHNETQDIVKTLLSDRTIGVPCKYDVIFDGTMTSPKKYLDLIRLLKKLGYKVFVVFIDKVPKDVIMKRAMDRYKKSGRFVPPFVIEEFFESGKDSLAKVKAKVDGYMIVDGSDSNYRVAEQKGLKLPKTRKYSRLGVPLKKRVTRKKG